MNDFRETDDDEDEDDLNAGFQEYGADDFDIEAALDDFEMGDYLS